MSKEQIILGVIVGVLFVVLTFWLTVRRLISERITLVWLGVSFGLLAIVLFPDWLYWIAAFFEFKFPSNAIFTFGMVVLLAFNLMLTVRITAIGQQLRRLTQEVAILSEKTSDRSQRGAPPEAGAATALRVPQ